MAFEPVTFLSFCLDCVLGVLMWFEFFLEADYLCLNIANLTSLAIKQQYDSNMLEVTNGPNCKSSIKVERLLDPRGSTRRTNRPIASTHFPASVHVLSWEHCSVLSISLSSLIAAKNYQADEIRFLTLNLCKLIFFGG